MVSTRSGSRRKEKANASAETPPTTDSIDQEGHPRRCSETAPNLIPALTPLWTPVAKIRKIHISPSIFRTAKRVLNKPVAESTDPMIPESEHQTSSPLANLEIVFENPVKDRIPNVSTGSHCSSVPSDSNHQLYTLDDLDMQLISQCQEAHQAAPQPAPNQLPEKSTNSHVGRTSQCTSLNITEFAQRHQGDTDDDVDEVQSALDPAFIFVNGHKVKKEYGPLLSAVFEKYGDITRESEGKPPTMISFFLERTCVIFERLKGMKFSQTTHKDLNEMLDEVRFLESQKLNLSWLHEKLQYISETRMSFREYMTLKEEGKRSDAMIAKLKNELSTEMAKSDRIKKRARDIKARVDDLWTHSLVHGLL
ncbi:hypothetical protein ACS0TY_024976 [Phlomoides rotata]